jgi:NADPH-dependent ferric siderophore reductase
MRDYTPRRYDAEARTLEIDFALHDAVPVADRLVWRLRG